MKRTIQGATVADGLNRTDLTLWRGRAAWHMQVIDIRIGHNGFGFDYAMSGDDRESE